MHKKEAIELLRQALSKMPHLRELHYDNQEFKLWRNRVETIIKYGLDGDDYNTFESVQPLDFLDDIGFENLEQSVDYPKKLRDYETALKSIIQKYEILGIEGERGKGGQVKKMDKERLMDFLNEKMQEIYDLEISSPNNAEFPKWYKTIEGFLFKVFGKDSWEYTTFKEAGIIHGIVEDSRTQYLKSVKSRETALASIINTHEHLGGEESLEQKEIVKYPIHLFDAMQLHQKVIKASRALFENEHYAQAIFEAFKAVENFVQDKSDLNLYGTNLMETVFNEENPIIKVPEAGYYYKDVQRGFKHLFIGAAQAIRNPKAHKEIIQKDPYITLEYLGFASFLLKRIDYWEAGIS